MNLVNVTQTPAAMLLRAEALLDERQMDLALEAFVAAQAEGAEPDRCSAGKWMCFMLLGEFEAAWRESDSIRKRDRPDEHRFWNGQHIQGRRVIVRCLHGLGDAVQMLRYAPRLRALCAELIVEVPPALLDTATWLDGVDRVITWGERAPAEPPAWDVQIEITELPYLFRMKRADLPLATRYLHVPPTRQLRLQSHLPSIGVVWAAGEWNPTRSIPFNEFKKLFRCNDAHYWNLQGGCHANDWASIASAPNLRDARELGDGLAVLISVISSMDLIVTVDTLAAHIAGALGVPAWLLLQHAADWRWMVNTSSSPWYPSLRLYRQHREGDWSAVLQQVACDLTQWISQAYGLPRRLSA